MSFSSLDYLSVRTPDGRRLYLKQYGVKALRWRFRSLRVGTSIGLTVLILMLTVIFFNSNLKSNATGFNIVAAVLIAAEVVALWWCWKSESREIGVVYEVDIGRRHGQVRSMALISPSVSRSSYLSWCEKYQLAPDPFDETGVKMDSTP